MPDTGPTTSPHVPEHLAGWYPGDLEAARRAHAEHDPDAAAPAVDEPSAAAAATEPPAAADLPDPVEMAEGAEVADAAEHEEAPAEGGRFLSAWYAGDLGAAVRAHEAHRAHDDDCDGSEVSVRLGRTTG